MPWRMQVRQHTAIATRRLVQRVLQIAAIPFALYLDLVVVLYFRQWSMLFFPGHTAVSTRLTPSMGSPIYFRVLHSRGLLAYGLMMQSPSFMARGKPHVCGVAGS
jgi:hypothetical protein